MVFSLSFCNLFWLDTFLCRLLPLSVQVANVEKNKLPQKIWENSAIFLGIGLWWAFQHSYQLWILGMGPFIWMGAGIINNFWLFPFVFPARDLILPLVQSRTVVVQHFTFILGCKCHEELTALWCSWCFTRRPEGTESRSYSDSAEDFSDCYYNSFYPSSSLEERRWAFSAKSKYCSVLYSSSSL